MKPVTRALWIVVAFLSLIGIAIIARRTAFLLPILSRGYHPPAVSPNPIAAQFAAVDDIFAHHPLLTLIHILPGSLFIVLGPLQFMSSIRNNHPQWHRWSGRIFLLCSSIIGVSALVMSFAMPAVGGVNQAAATTCFGIFFLFALAKAFWHIRRREVLLHREWMIRAYAIGVAVATIRPIVGIFVATSRLSGLTLHEFFGIAFWIGFVLHLIAAEAWIHTTLPPQVTVQ